jgi:hypothetical protein
LFAGVLGERCFEGGDEASNICSRTAMDGGHQDKALVARTARCDQLGVKPSEIAQVGRDNRTLFTTSNRDNISIG